MATSPQTPPPPDPASASAPGPGPGPASGDRPPATQPPSPGPLAAQQPVAQQPGARPPAARRRRDAADLAGIRLVATDLDGTLLDATSQVSPRAAKAVAAARAVGIHVIPATGRPPRSLWTLAAAGGLGPVGVCSNGAAIVDLESLSVVEIDPFAGEAAVRIVELARQAVPGILLAVNDLETFQYEPRFVQREAATWDEKVREIPDVAATAALGCIKLIARSPGVDSVTLMDQLAESVGEHAQVTTSGLDWVEMMAPGVSKAKALQRVCDLLGIDAGDVVFVGDNYNDLQALAWAGLPMAPANAVDAALDLAGRVLPANTDDGVAVLLEELVALHA